MLRDVESWHVLDKRALQVGGRLMECNFAGGDVDRTICRILDGCYRFGHSAQLLCEGALGRS